MTAKRGIFVAPFDELADPRLLMELAARAEELGWDGFFLWDHIRYRAPTRLVLDPWVALGAIATATDRLRIGPMVTPISRRRPHKLARETVTLDHLSGGRVTLGVRPEALHVANGSDPADYTFDTSVDVLEPLGNEILVNFRAGGAPIVARVDPSVRLKAHEQVRMALDPERVHFFDSKTEAAI